MAEIKIEKKTPIWPWILVALILAALAYYFFIYKNANITDDDVNRNDTITNIDSMNTEDDSTYGDNQTNDNAAMIASINEYKNVISDPNMNMDHTFTSNALNKLITATKDMAEKANVDIKTNLDAARVQADAIEKDPKSLDHADKIKDASVKISSALKTIQGQKFSMLEADSKSVEDAAMSMDVKMATLNQKDKVKSFLDNAGNLLMKMDSNLQNSMNQ